jgi:hypothetical protein
MRRRLRARYQRTLTPFSALDAQAARDHAETAGQDTAEDDALIADLDEQITASSVHGKALPERPKRRARSTRRRQDAPDLPVRPISARTVGKT